ncbi:zinc c2h2 finger domain containing protein [Ophiostoma piceae UAMH 11346]|uniref:Zinc c2h2 finger domain containing protein n=1 Tax=Ophiostoma piceae (strain UAMH 11346) TaxID=1262450 RepID=S3C4E6_OPHP1|nr:zinc c2h2 finger domain containing protein [Ophiostoma piceae UAMH 11346]
MSYECDRCDRCFNSPGALDQHQDVKNHYAYECRRCDETWPSSKGRIEHEDEDHNYHHCSQCDRGFNSYNALQNHLRSRIHTGSNVACPFCRRNFATATGVTHHLERGSCPSAQNVNRDSMYKFVRRNDPSGSISKRLLTWDGEPEPGPALATADRAWNGSFFQCYICQRQFTKITGLNQHLQSSVHMQQLYHCPNHECRKDFKTLAALVNHFESESCGFMRFGQVQSGISDMVSGQRLLGQ